MREWRSARISFGLALDRPFRMEQGRARQRVRPLGLNSLLKNSVLSKRRTAEAKAVAHLERLTARLEAAPFQNKISAHSWGAAVPSDH